MIKRIMLVMAALFIIPLLIMTVHLATYEYNSAIDTYTSYMSSMLENINSETAEYVDDLSAHALDTACSNAFRQLFKNIGNPELLADARETLGVAIKYSETAQNGGLLTMDGKLVLTHTSLPANYAPDYDLLTQARVEKRPIVDFRFFQHDSSIYFTIYAPVINNGEVTGYYVQFVDSSHLELLLSAHKSYVSDEFFIVDANNMMVSPNKFVNITEGLDISKNEFANNFQTIEAWYVDKIYTFEYFDSEKGTMMNAMFIRDSVTDLCYIYACPVEKFSKGSHVIITIILLYAIGIGLIIFAAYSVMQKHMQKSFNEIFKAIEIYEMGDWTYRPVVSTDDEIGSISKSLWSLAQNLSSMYMDVKFNEYRYKLAMEFSGDLIYDYNLTQNIFESDKLKWENLFPVPHTKNEKRMAEEFVKLMHPDDIVKFENYRKQMFQDCYNDVEKQSSLEFRMKLKDEQYHWIERKDVLVKGTSDNIEHIIGILVLIDERKNSELALTKKATIDSLTSLYNRFTFINKVDEVLKKGKVSTGAVIFVDLDDFKFINDTYGHDAGDDVLRFVGKVIREVSDGRGFGGRYGGDEFLLFLKDIQIAEQVASEILEGLAKEFTVRGNGNVIKIHSSIGIAKFPEHDTTVDGLIKKADDAMYYSKKNGKNRYNVYDVNKGDGSGENKE